MSVRQHVCILHVSYTVYSRYSMDGPTMWSNVSTTAGWINVKFYRDVHVPQRMNLADFGDPPTFPVAPP